MHPAEREDSAEFSKLEDISALGVFHVNSKALITEAGTNCRPDIRRLKQHYCYTVRSLTYPITDLPPNRSVVQPDFWFSNN